MPLIEKRCEVCSKVFSVPPWRGDVARFCSRACKGVAAAKRYSGERVKMTCPGCGSMFEAPKCHEGRRKFCSDRCADKCGRDSGARGDRHGNWRGGRSQNSDGYLYLSVSGHPFATTGSYVFEHRIVVEEAMRGLAPEHPFLVDVDGTKYLRPEIDVHHINGNRRDNRRENLLACTKEAHTAIHCGNPPVAGEVWPRAADEEAFSPWQVSKVCKHCGKGFFVKRSLAKKGLGIFCSRSCYLLGRPKTYKVRLA